MRYEIQVVCNIVLLGDTTARLMVVCTHHHCRTKWRWAHGQNEDFRTSNPDAFRTLRAPSRGASCDEHKSKKHNYKSISPPLLGFCNLGKIKIRCCWLSDHTYRRRGHCNCDASGKCRCPCALVNEAISQKLRQTFVDPLPSPPSFTTSHRFLVPYIRLYFHKLHRATFSYSCLQCPPPSILRLLAHTKNQAKD